MIITARVIENDFIIYTNNIKIEEFRIHSVKAHYFKGDNPIDYALKHYLKKRFFYYLNEEFVKVDGGGEYIKGFKEYKEIIDFIKQKNHCKINDIFSVEISENVSNGNTPYYIFNHRHILSHLKKFGLIILEEDTIRVTDKGYKFIDRYNRSFCSYCGRLLSVSGCFVCGTGTTDMSLYEKSNRF
jgi:predicted transcriptional regulator